MDNFFGNHRKIIKAIKKCQISSCLSKIGETSLCKTCYSAVFIKKMNVLWMFTTKSFLKNSKPPPPTCSCEIFKFLQIAAREDTLRQLLFFLFFGGESHYIFLSMPENFNFNYQTRKHDYM